MLLQRSAFRISYRGWIAVLFVFLTPLAPVGCGARAVDLRPFTLVESSDALAFEAKRTVDQAERALGSQAWRQAKEVTIVLEDRWGSSLLRQFTPLSEDDALLRLTFRPSEPGARLESLDPNVPGARSGASSEVVQTWNWTSTDDEQYWVDGTPNFWVGLYIESLRFYVEAPYLSANYSAYAGSRRVRRGSWIHGAYLAPSGPAFQPREDQRIHWIDEETGRVTSIDITYRAVSDRYRGTVSYEDYEDLDGIAFPHRITIGEVARDRRPVHVIVVKDVSIRAG